MRRSLALLIILALAIPRFLIPSSSATPTTLSEKHVMHDIYIDPNIYNSVGHVYIVEFSSLKTKNAFVEMVKSKAIAIPSGVKFLHAYEYLPFIILGGDLESVITFTRTIPGTVAIRANEKHYLQRNLNPGENVPTSLSNVLSLGAPTFRNAGYTGMGIVIAIIDTGIYKQHPEFNYDNGTCKVLYEESFVLTIYGYDHNETNPDDGVGHGTMVAGAAAGLGKQPDGQGVAPDAALVNLKVFPSGQDTYATTAGIIAAIDKAIQLKTDGVVDIDIINMSLGGSPDVHYDPEIAAVNAAIEHGITVVIAAGNEGDNGRATGYVSAPGIAPQAITAGAAYNRNDTIEGYSSPGPTPRLGVKPDVVAPGTGSYPVPPFVSSFGYRAASGTSFASPHTAGSVALILQYIKANTNLNDFEAIGYAKAVLMYSAVHYVKDATSNITFDQLRIGAGFINLTNAYEILSHNPAPGYLVVMPTHLPVGLVYNVTGTYPAEGPVFPRSEYVYTGQEIFVNFTFTSGVPYHIIVHLTGDLPSVLQVESETYFQMSVPTYTYGFKAIVNGTAGTYTGQIQFVATNGTVLASVDVVLNVRGEPTMKLLRDLHHTDRGYDTPYGQFYFFARNLEAAGIAIDILTLDENFTLDTISAYDRIFTGDFASGVTLTVDDAKTFINYIKAGGHVIIIVMDTTFYDIKAIGRLTYAFGIEFGTQSIQGSGGSTVNAQRNSSLPFGLSGSMPMYGIPVLPMNPGVLELASYTGIPVAAAAVTKMGGALLVFGTNFLFDNRAMTDQYGIAATDIMANVLALFTFNYANVFTGYTLEISGDLTLGGSISVSTNIPALAIYHNDRVMSEQVSGSFTIERAGPNALGISFNYGSYAFGVVCPIRVEPSEYNAPQVMQESNVTYTTSDKNLTIKIDITDETGIEASKFDVSVSVLKVTGRMSIKPSDVYIVTSGSNAVLYIVFTPDKFAFLFGTSNEAKLRIVVTVYDLNYNYDTKTLDHVAEINTAPELTVEYSTSPGEISLSVTINDDDSQNRLIVYLDGNVVYNETVNVGETINITISADAGSHNVTVVAIDPVGNCAKRSETISVPQEAAAKNTRLIIAAVIIVIIIAILAYLFLAKKGKA